MMIHRTHWVMGCAVSMNLQAVHGNGVRELTENHHLHPLLLWCIYAPPYTKLSEYLLQRLLTRFLPFLFLLSLQGPMPPNHQSPAESAKPCRFSPQPDLALRIKNKCRPSPSFSAIQLPHTHALSSAWCRQQHRFPHSHPIFSTQHHARRTPGG